jgi:tRNA G10  N-methylase Trm11
MDNKDFDVRELLQDCFQKLSNQDTEIQFLKLQMEAKDLEILELQKENYELKSINATKLRGNLFVAGYSNLAESDKNIANEAALIVTSLESEVIHQSIIIDKYQKGIRERFLECDKKWMDAQKYLLEEIPKHKTLKLARKQAAARAGIFVQERHLVRKLPDPR